MLRKNLTGYYLDLGLIPYRSAFAIQEQILEALMRDQLPPTIILLENPAVFTIGRTGSRANVLASARDLKRLEIEVLEVNRGGDVSYHAPGQLTVAPLIYLGDLNLNANQYLHRLEDVLIELLSTYGVRGVKKEGYPGVWWHQAKIGFVGIAVKHGYTFHGFSFNLNLDLTPFNLINPCGVCHMPVTSLQKILGQDTPMPEAKERLFAILEEMFSFSLKKVSWEDIGAVLTPSSA